MKSVLSLLLLLTLIVSGCAVQKVRKKLLADCRYMLVKYPGVKSLHPPECFIIWPKQLVKKADFLASYDFERFIQSIYPPDLTLVVTRKGSSLPTPILIKSGRAGERIFKPLNHTVDHTGEIHRYQFGRYAVNSIEGIRARDWEYHVILTLEPQK